MRYPSLETLKNASWYVYSDEAVEQSHWYMPRLTHPSFLLPEESPDGLWHLFAHTWVGIQHYISTSGLRWEPQHILFMRGHSPSIFREGQTYYLIYESHDRSFEYKKRKGESTKSRILISSSTDLSLWSEPRTLLEAKDVPYSSHYSAPRLSRPQLIYFEGRYRLYFGASMMRLYDSHEKVITYFSVAESDKLEGPYVCSPKPLIKPEPESSFHNLAVGSVKIIPCSEALAALNCSFYYDKENNCSRSSLFLLSSEDGYSWKNEKLLMSTPEKGWASGYLSDADCSFKADENTWYCYFSAFEHKNAIPLYMEKESLGLLLGKVRQ